MLSLEKKYWIFSGFLKLIFYISWFFELFSAVLISVIMNVITMSTCKYYLVHVRQTLPEDISAASINIYYGAVVAGEYSCCWHKIMLTKVLSARAATNLSCSVCKRKLIL